MITPADYLASLGKLIDYQIASIVFLQKNFEALMFGVNEENDNKYE